MCRFFSAVLTKDSEFWHESDSHETIIRESGLHADGAKGANILRVELVPSAKTRTLEDFPSYTFQIDQDLLPKWFDKVDAELRTREALARRFGAGKVERVGSLVIPAKSCIICDALTSVGGYLDINADAKLDALTSVGGDLYISADAKLDALTSVGGALYISADAKLDALTSVGGYLDINADAKLDAPKLVTVNGLPYKPERLKGAL